MMDEKDLKEHWDNIALVSKLKKANKYNYLEGKQITDEELKESYEQSLRNKEERNEKR